MVLDSGGYESPEEDEDEDSDEDFVNAPPGPAERFQRLHKPRDEAIKKPVSVDANGYPYGIMKSCLEDDVKLLAKDLDPTVGWDLQPPSERERFYRRLYAGIGFSIHYQTDEYVYVHSIIG